GNYQRRRQRKLIPLGEFEQSIGERWGNCADRLVSQMSLDIPGEPVGGFVSPASVLLQRFHNNPIQIPAHHPAQTPWLDLSGGGHARELVSVKRVQPGAWPWRIHLANRAQHFR